MADGNNIVKVRDDYEYISVKVMILKIIRFSW